MITLNCRTNSLAIKIGSTNTELFKMRSLVTIKYIFRNLESKFNEF